VTDKISKKCLAAFRVLSNCMKRWLFFVYFTNTKKYGWQCRCQYTKAIAWLFAYFMQAQRLLCCAFGGYLAWLLAWQVATKRCELNVGFYSIYKKHY
jgi:hypothetical protein